MKLKTKIKLAVGGVAATVFIIFIVLNRQRVELNLIIAEVTMPRSVMLIGVFIIGSLVGWIANSLVSQRPKKVRA